MEKIPVTIGILTYNSGKTCKMSAVGLMEVGLHGHQNFHIKEIAGDKTLLDRELKESMELTAKETGKAPRVYAYAFGQRDPRTPHSP